MDAEQTSIHRRAREFADGLRIKEADLLELFQDIEKYKVHLAAGYPSVFLYATEELSMSESQAYVFIRVARKAVEIPELKTEIKTGRLAITKAHRIAAIITHENKHEWIEKAKNLSKHFLEIEVMRVNPEANSKESLRRVSETHFSLRLSLTDEVVQKVKRVQNLESTRLRQNRSLEQTVEATLDFYLKQKDPLLKCVKKTKERNIENLTSGAAVPGQSVGDIGYVRKPLTELQRAQVLKRDKACCQFRNDGGRICGAERFVEIHHKIPVSQGGMNDLDNLISLCWQHHHFLHGEELIDHHPKKRESLLVRHGSEKNGTT